MRTHDFFVDSLYEMVHLDIHVTLSFPQAKTYFIIDNLWKTKKKKKGKKERYHFGMRSGPLEVSFPSIRVQNLY